MAYLRARLHNHPVNLGTGERVASIVIGAAMLCRMLRLPVIGPLLLGVGGGALMWRGISGYCPVTARLEVDAAPPEGESDPVNRTSEDSFPASDPPSWTPVSGSSRH